MPENGFAHCQIVASHGDSPTFKLKAHAEGEAAGAYIRLDVERYGGMIMSTWFDTSALHRRAARWCGRTAGWSPGWSTLTATRR